MILDQSAALAAHERLLLTLHDRIRTIGEPPKKPEKPQRRCIVKGKEYRCAKDAAKALGRSYNTVWVWIKRGTFGSRYL